MPEEPHLVAYCFVAMFTVLVLLSVMAGIIWGLTVVFPGKDLPPVAPRRKASGPASPSPVGPSHQIDSAVVAAISTAAAGSHPGMVVTHIQEWKQ